MSGDQIRVILPDGSHKVYGKKKVQVPADSDASKARKFRLPRARASQIKLHAVANKTPAPNQNFKVYKLDELRLTPAQFAEAKKQILELYKVNTFNPFEPNAKLTDEMKKRGFLVEPTSFKKFQFQQSMSELIDASEKDPYGYPFFVAVNPQEKNKIIGVMQVPLTQEFMHHALPQTTINTDVTMVVDNLIRSNAIPEMTSTNAWHNAGIAIDPKFQGKGIAKALLGRKIEWLKTTQAEAARFLLLGYDKENLASEKWHSKLNCLNIDPSLTEFQIANRPCVLKILDLNQPLFK